MRRSFTLDCWLDDGWFVGRLREVPGVFSQGETLAELESNIRDAFQLVVDEAAGPIKDTLCAVVRRQLGIDSGAS